MSEPRQPSKVPLTVEQQEELALFLIHFFSPANAHRVKGTPRGSVEPLSLGDAYRALHEKEWPPLPSPFGLDQFLKRLSSGGFLYSAGVSPQGSPPMSSCYYSFTESTSQEAKGRAWLTKALGWEFLVHCVGFHIAMVVGVDPKDEEASGSGFLLTSRHVLTNRHVLADMTAREVYVGDRNYPIAATKVHTEIDVGIAEIAEDVDWHPVGVSFREPHIVEPLLCLGHPPVPKTKVPPEIVAQSGEVVGFVQRAHDDQRYVLFSATARPGNSGGPIFGKDGRIVGIVSRSLEEQERKDGSHRFPFFAAVPSGEIRRAIEDMGSASILPWETYDAA